MIKVKVFQKKVKLQGQSHKVKNYGNKWKVLSQGIYICNIKALSLLVRKLWPRLKFFKVGQTSMSRSQGRKLRYHVKGIVTWNTHMQYESPITSGLKVMAKVKVFVHASHADADTDAYADGRVMTLALWTYVPAR